MSSFIPAQIMRQLRAGDGNAWLTYGQICQVVRSVNSEERHGRKEPPGQNHPEVRAIAIDNIFNRQRYYIQCVSVGVACAISVVFTVLRSTSRARADQVQLSCIAYVSNAS